MTNLSRIFSLVLSLCVSSSISIQSQAPQKERGVITEERGSVSADSGHEVRKRSPSVFNAVYRPAPHWKLDDTYVVAPKPTPEDKPPADHEDKDAVVAKLLDKVDRIEQREVANNVIFKNVKGSEHENHTTTLHKVMHILVNLMRINASTKDIARAVRVDGESTSGLRPILVTFVNFEMKMLVLARNYLLKQTVIEVMPEYSELVNKRRRELYPYLMVKTFHDHSVYLLYDKLLLDGVTVSLEELEAERKLVEEKEAEEISDESLREETLLWKSYNDTNDAPLEDYYDVPIPDPQDLNICWTCSYEEAVV